MAEFFLGFIAGYVVGMVMAAVAIFLGMSAKKHREKD